MSHKPAYITAVVFKAHIWLGYSKVKWTRFYQYILTLCFILVHGHHSVLWISHTYWVAWVHTFCLAMLSGAFTQFYFSSNANTLPIINYNDPWQSHFPSHTYKCWYSLPLLAYTITTVGPHFESKCRQWSEPWLSCDDSGSGRTIHKLFTMETTVMILEMNFIFSDISCMCSIGWWVPVQCHRRIVCIHYCCQIFNWVWSESCAT